MDYTNMLNQVIHLLEDRKEEHWIVIGDNSSGKSELLQKYVKRKKRDVYYIDSVNRYINANEINLSKDLVQYLVTSEDIVNRRLEKEFFNYKDSFGNNEHIELLYGYYKKDLQQMFREFLGVSIHFKREKLNGAFGEGDINTFINNKKMELSSGYQAIFRIFAEILFYTGQLQGNGLIVIDEMDEYLSPNHARRILEYLITKFPDNKFLISTHSSDLICGTSNCNIIAFVKM